MQINEIKEIIKGVAKLAKTVVYSGNITDEVAKRNISEAKDIMREFVGDNFGDDNLELLEECFDKVPTYVDYSPSKVKYACAYFQPLLNQIYIMDDYLKEKTGTIYMIHTIIHEYAHAIVSESSMNFVIEESFANLFAEMCINHYIQKGKVIKSIPSKKLRKLRDYGYYNYDLSYMDEGVFARTMMFLSRVEGSEMDMMEEYFFGSRDKFIEQNVELYGNELKDIWENKLNKIERIADGKASNREKYLPEATNELGYMLSNILTLNELRQYDREKKSGLYNIENDVLDSIYSAKIDKKIEMYLCDIAGVRHYNDITEVLGRLNGNNLRNFVNYWGNEVSYKNSSFGYTKFMKSFVDGLYKMNRGNLSNFDRFLPFIGTIPIEVFEKIVNDRGVNNLRDITNLALKYGVIHNQENKDYATNSLKLLILMKRKIGAYSDISEQIIQDENFQNRRKSMVNLSEEMLEALSDFHISNDYLDKIFKIYGKFKKDVMDEHILESIDVLNEIPFFDSPDFVKNGLIRIKKDIQSCINVKGIKDLNMLRELDKLYSSTRIPVDKKKVTHDVELAIINLAANGYTITNSAEIMQNIQEGNFKDIKIKPMLNIENLNAFVGNYDRTNILFNMALEDFLQSKDLVNSEESLMTCKKILTPEMKAKLNISDRMEKRLCWSINNRAQNSRYRNSSLLIMVNGIAEDSLNRMEIDEKYIRKSEKKEKIDLIKSVVEASRYTVSNSKIIRSEDLLKRGMKTKLKEQYGLDYKLEE